MLDVQAKKSPIASTRIDAEHQAVRNKCGGGLSGFCANCYAAVHSSQYNQIQRNGCISGYGCFAEKLQRSKSGAFLLSGLCIQSAATMCH